MNINRTESEFYLMVVGIPAMIFILIVILIGVVVWRKNKWCRTRVTPYKDREIYSIGSSSQVCLFRYISKFSLLRLL